MHEYLKEHILDELKGAEDYMAKAIEHKGTLYGNKFYEMSQMEVEHANCLTKMFTKMEKPATITDAEYGKMNKEILDAYSTSMNKVRELKKLFWE